VYKMGKEPMKYNGSEFGLQNVYDKLTAGVKRLPAEQAVDALLDGADTLKRGIDQLIEKFYHGAEQQQESVMNGRASAYKHTAEQVLKATQSGDLTAIDDALQSSIEASLQCKESASKMRHIKNRGYERYDSKKELGAYVRELDTMIGKKVHEPELLEGE